MPLKIADLRCNNNIKVNTTNGKHLAKAPDHVKVLRDMILDFHGTIQQQFDLKDDQDPWDIQGKPTWDRRTSYAQNAIIKTINNAEKIQKKASSHDEANLQEQEWSKIFEDYFFKPLHNRFQPESRDSR
jgi:hypothetical protein